MCQNLYTLFVLEETSNIFSQNYPEKKSKLIVNNTLSFIYWVKQLHNAW